MEEIIGRWDCTFRERFSFVCFVLQYFSSHIGVFDRDNLLRFSPLCGTGDEDAVKTERDFPSVRHH